MEEIKYYEDKIELHDNHTFWKLENKTIDNEKITTEEISLLLNKYFDKFTDETGIEIGVMGRSGRHICVEDTEYNRKHYKSLVKVALKLEKEFIEEFNSIDFTIKKCSIEDLDREDLLHLIGSYNNYIIDFYNEHDYTDSPVCVYEFYDNEYQEIIKEMEN